MPVLTVTKFTSVPDTLVADAGTSGISRSSATQWSLSVSVCGTCSLCLQVIMTERSLSRTVGLATLVGTYMMISMMTKLSKLIEWTNWFSSMYIYVLLTREREAETSSAEIMVLKEEWRLQDDTHIEPGFDLAPVGSCTFAPLHLADEGDEIKLSIAALSYQRLCDLSMENPLVQKIWQEAH